MDNQNEQLEHLAEMRTLMERSSRFISLSGLSGIFAGIAGLIGAGLMFRYYGLEYDYPARAIYKLNGTIRVEFLKFLFADAAAVLCLALGFGLFFNRRKAKRLNQAIWDKSAKRVVVNMLIPLVAGAALGLIMLKHGHIEYIAAITLIFYGMGLVNSSKYTLHDIRYLGICEIILGLLSAYFIGYGLIFWAVGFGLLHIIYGVIMYLKYEKE